MRRPLILAPILLIAALAGCQSDSSISASSPEVSPCNRLRNINVPAQGFDDTAHSLVHTTGCFIKTDLADTGSIHVAAVSGHLSIAAALSRALAPTQLQVTQNGDTLIVHS
ncbi:hypothetical protein [Salinisphaera sp. LB1]|uniref:hypothetical protein n=1 Tax=Salinisphaera sp. LB1 TaxID=2183911 RepID=UPI000D705A10|nr:hypothetical protein [Salinisphaera sp. LB1]AWN14921.1 hypothetical protein SALB1_0714 [Salinisphaera sp. LB1]